MDSLKFASGKKIYEFQFLVNGFLYVSVGVILATQLSWLDILGY